MFANVEYKHRQNENTKDLVKAQVIQNDLMTQFLMLLGTKQALNENHRQITAESGN